MKPFLNRRVFSVVCIDRNYSQFSVALIERIMHRSHWQELPMVGQGEGGMTWVGDPNGHHPNYPSLEVLHMVSII